MTGIFKKKVWAGMLLLLVPVLIFWGIPSMKAEKSSAMRDSLADARIKVYLAGDSTVSNYSDSLAPRAGWGQVIGERFDKDVVVINEAKPGRSSKSFIEEGRLTRILTHIDQGDYLFIQFGHNDAKIKDPARYTEPYTSYKSYLKQYIDGAKAKNAIPVLVTPVERRRFDESGTAVNSHGSYPEAMKELGKEEDVPVIDLTGKSRALFQELGPEKTKDIILWAEPGKNPNYPDGVRDNVHFQEAGAKVMAGFVVQGIEELNIVPLKNHIKNGK